jgi:hypothetical protein
VLRLRLLQRLDFRPFLRFGEQSLFAPYDVHTHDLQRPLHADFGGTAALCFACSTFDANSSVMGFSPLSTLPIYGPVTPSSLASLFPWRSHLADFHFPQFSLLKYRINRFQKGDFPSGQKLSRLIKFCIF